MSTVSAWKRVAYPVVRDGYNAPHCVAVHDGELFVVSLVASAVSVYGVADGVLRRRIGDKDDVHKLTRPRGIVVHNGELFVADKHRVAVCDAASGCWNRDIGAGEGTEKGQLSYATDVAVRGDELFVVDSNDRVSVFAIVDGRCRRYFGSSKKLCYPSGIAIDGDKVYVANTCWDCVSVFGATDGRWLGDIGTVYSGRRLSSTMGLTVFNGELFATNMKNRCVSVFGTEDGRWRRDISGGFDPVLPPFCDPTKKRGYLSYPIGLALHDGELFVCDAHREYVAVLDAAIGDGTTAVTAAVD